MFESTWECTTTYANYFLIARLIDAGVDALLEQHAAASKQIEVREAQVGGRILVTTLLDQHAVHKRELDALYRRRWNIELDLGYIKTTLGLDVLRCRTPAMIEKEP